MLRAKPPYTLNPPAAPTARALLGNPDYLGSRSGVIAVPEAVLNGHNRDRLFVTTIKGDCLEPEIMDGSKLVCSLDAEIRTRDFVVVFFRNGRTPIIKRVMIPCTETAGMWHLDGLGSGILLEMLNPRRQFEFRHSDLLGVHRVIYVMTEKDPAAGRAPRARERVVA